MAKNPTPSPSVPAAAPSPLRQLLERIATAKAAAGKSGVPFKFGSGMNHVPNRFHLDHDNGDVVAALKAIGENPEALLAELP